VWNRKKNQSFCPKFLTLIKIRMKKEEFETHYKKVIKSEEKINHLIDELDETKELIKPYFQFHRPLITISTLKEKYWHCNCPIIIDGKMNRHSVYLGSKDKFEGKDDKKLIRLSQIKMEELLRKKYPQMFE
jgi:hypothetical protein